MRLVELQGSGFSPLQQVAIVGVTAQTFTAAGATQAAATAITTTNTYITTASEGHGAILPSASGVGDGLKVCNSTSVDEYIYPPVGYKLNGGTTNAPLLLAPNRAGTFTCVDGNNWMVTF
jgi:hypothetical protein